jgi:hypothetical protein
MILKIILFLLVFSGCKTSSNDTVEPSSEINSSEDGVFLTSSESRGAIDFSALCVSSGGIHTHFPTIADYNKEQEFPEFRLDTEDDMKAFESVEICDFSKVEEAELRTFEKNSLFACSHFYTASYEQYGTLDVFDLKAADQTPSAAQMTAPIFPKSLRFRCLRYAQEVYEKHRQKED